MSFAKLTGTLGLVGAMLFARDARGQDFDVAPKVSGGQIVTEAFQDGLELLIPDVRVFAYEFGEIPGQPFFTQDPGFHPQPNKSGFAPGTQIGFEVTAGMTYWNGVGAPAFGALPTGETMTISRGAHSIIVSNVVPAPPGFNIGAVDENGEFDDHLESVLGRAGGLDPTDGIYLIPMRLTSDDPSLLNSLPIFILYSNGAGEEALQDARVFIRDTFAPGTNLPELPEPSMVGVTLVATARAALRRRRGTTFSL